jgi:2-hydroxy-3-oxopropionate reductase
MKKGHTLVVSGHNKAVAAEFEKDGATVFETPREIAANSDIVITMLPNSPQVEEVVLGKDGVIEGAKKGSCVIDMSSIAPLSSRKIAAELEKVGVDMLDAPVSGGEPKAIDGTISVMVGGKQEVFDKYKDVIGCMAASVVRTGDIGAGNATKLANQIIVAINIAAVSEALTLAAKVGVEPELVYKAIRGGLAGSTVLDAKAPMMMDRNFKPGFRINLHIKDLKNVLDTSHEVGVTLPLTASVMEIMQALKADGHEAEDHSSIVRYYEKLDNIIVKR